MHSYRYFLHNRARKLSGLTLEDAEKMVIAETMESCGGNKTEAAKRLGIIRKTLLAKMIRYGLVDAAETE